MLKKTGEYNISEGDFQFGFRIRKAEENFKKLWTMKSSARESLKDWLLATNIAPKLSEICANACSELIENCIKYSRNDSMATVSISASDVVITVETINRAEKEHKDFIMKIAEKLNAAPDPQLLFTEMLLNPIDGKSQLGLAKILMETKGKVEIVQEPDEAVVHVRLKMKAGDKR